MVKNSKSGKQYEDIVELCIKRSCEKNGLSRQPQSNVGPKPGGGAHIIDWELWVADEPDRRGLLSCKIQNTGGTAEEKIPYEVLKLLHTMDHDPRYKVGWIVLGGTGWSAGLLKYYLEDLTQFLPAMVGRVSVLRTDALISTNLLIP